MSANMTCGPAAPVPAAGGMPAPNAMAGGLPAPAAGGIQVPMLVARGLPVPAAGGMPAAGGAPAAGGVPAANLVPAVPGPAGGEVPAAQGIQEFQLHAKSSISTMPVLGPHGQAADGSRTFYVHANVTSRAQDHLMGGPETSTHVEGVVKMKPSAVMQGCINAQGHIVVRTRDPILGNVAANAVAAQIGNLAPPPLAGQAEPPVPRGCRMLTLNQMVRKTAAEAGLPRGVCLKAMKASWQVIADELRAGRNAQTGVVTFSANKRARTIKSVFKTRFGKAVFD